MTPGNETTRRSFIGAIGLTTAAVGLTGCATAPAPVPRAIDLSRLPRGGNPERLTLSHFPSRMHAFVWRNWQLVPAEKMAQVVGATANDIRALGKAMDLGAQPRITTAQQRRSYITVIKRNWHLLPYEQLIALLGWDVDELAYTLREDDFLFVKLGSLKPKCEPLRWTKFEIGEREKAVAKVVREEFGAANVSEPGDPLFAFVERLSKAPAQTVRANANEGLRFCYSYFALYGDPLLEPDLDPYPDGYLARLAEAGVNGVWLQAVLHKLAPFHWDPKLSSRYEERLKNLQQLVARAERHGIKVFLYLNEPRAHPVTFYAQRETLKGVVENDYAALCTSVVEVRRWLASSITSICQAVPKLGGFFTISASENLSNCWSHGNGKGCPRCSSRSPAEVIAEVNGAFAEGVRRAGRGQRLIVWDWGWSDAWAADAIARLPENVSLMSVSEWSLPIERGGVKTAVGEYSISSIGPGPRAQKHWALAKQRGLQTVAKIQAGNTWELSAVPWIPVAANVAEHARRLHELQLGGVMLGWTLGGYPSPNLAAVAEIFRGGELNNVAARRFGLTLAPAFLTAWNAFRDAFAEFPFHIGVVYGAPLQNGPSNLLWAEPTRYQRTMVAFGYDDLNGWRGVYPAPVFISQLEKVAAGFDRALEPLKAAVSAARDATNSQRRAAEDEIRMARVAAIHWRSVANQARFIQGRDALAEARTSAQAAPVCDDIERILKDEIVLARELHAIQSADSRIGFEASNHYYYVPLDLAEKVLNCRDLLERWLPGQRQRAA